MKHIRPVKNLHAVVRVPGSKSYTQRALIAAALADGRSDVLGALISEDIEVLMAALRAMGVIIHQNNGELTVEGTGGRLTAPEAPIFMGNNGTGLRLLTTMACLGHGEFILDGNERMRQRPLEPLVDALRQIGVDISCIHENGCPPVRIRAQGLPGGTVRLSSGLSSQYLSSLLLSGPYAARNLEIRILGTLLSRPYVSMTLEVMERFGAKVQQGLDQSFVVGAPRPYRPATYHVEGDVSSATYFMAAAAVCGGSVRISNINPDSLQGDLRFAEILNTLGCRVDKSGPGLQITGPLSNHADLSFDLQDVPDMVPALAIVCAFRQGKSLLSRIGHLRVKESDRVAALSRELRKMGVRVEEQQDRMTIQGTPVRGAQIACYDDHRIAMSFAVAGLAIGGVVITDPGCVRKSFPDFWEILASLGGEQA